MRRDLHIFLEDAATEELEVRKVIQREEQDRAYG